MLLTRPPTTMLFTRTPTGSTPLPQNVKLLFERLDNYAADYPDTFVGKNIKHTFHIIGGKSARAAWPHAEKLQAVLEAIEWIAAGMTGTATVVIENGRAVSVRTQRESEFA